MKQLMIFLFLLSVLSFSLSAQDSTATVHFYRTNSIKGAAITYKIYYDSTLVGQMRPGTVYSCDVKPGVNKFTAKTESKEFVFITTKPGEEYFVNCTLAFGVLVGRPKFEVVTHEVGEAAIKKIRAKEKEKSK